MPMIDKPAKSHYFKLVKNLPGKYKQPKKGWKNWGILTNWARELGCKFADERSFFTYF